MVEQPERSDSHTVTVYPWHKKYNVINPYVLHRMCMKRTMIPSTIMVNDVDRLNRMKIPQDVRDARQSFANGNGTFQNDGHGYVIISKTDFNTYFFDENHNLVEKSPVLLGSAVGTAMSDQAR